MANLLRNVYWPKMQEKVARFIRGCMICYTNKPSNMKQGLYHPLPIPTHPWENISMEFVAGLPTTSKGHDYLFVVVYRFSKMCVLMPCKNTINGKEVANLFFGQVWVHFRIPSCIVSDRDTIVLSAFRFTLWEKMEITLKRSTTFHQQIDG